MQAVLIMGSSRESKLMQSTQIFKVSNVINHVIGIWLPMPAANHNTVVILMEGRPGPVEVERYRHKTSLRIELNRRVGQFQVEYVLDSPHIIYK